MIYTKPHIRLTTSSPSVPYNSQPQKPPYRVILSELSPFLGDALSQCLTANGIETTTHSGSLDAEIQLASSGCRIIAILDPVHDRHATFERAKQLTELEIPYAFLTQDIKPAWLSWAIQLGATGWITLDGNVEEIGSIISQLLTGRIKEFWSAKARQMLDLSNGKPQLTEDYVASKLTALQLEVFLHLAEGKTVKKVAEEMSLTVKAVDSHKYRIMQRLMLHDRVYLSRLAIREGWIDA